MKAPNTKRSLVGLLATLDSAIRALQPMKTKLRFPTLLPILSGILAASTAFGQTTYTWTGAGNGVSLAVSNNWSPAGLPSGATQDTALWDGVTTSNLVITYGSTSLPSTGYGSQGINLDLSANQTNSVQIISAGGTSAGVGVNYITIAAGAGAFTLGDGSANNLKVFGRPAGGIHSFENESTNPAAIGPSVEWQAGGGSGYTYDFLGAGNWIVNSYLYPDNGAFSTTTILVEGPGSVFWTAGKTGSYNPNSPPGPIVISGGALVIKSSGLITSSGQTIDDEGTLEFDAPSQSQNIPGVISGAGMLWVNNGTLTLSAQNTYTGEALVTGGELIANSAENAGSSGPLGVGGTISFTGGTLGFSVNNTFDYSSRFDTTAGQAYSFDTAGQNVTFGTALGGSGSTLTKLGSGTLTLSAASTYTGLTAVSGGRLLFQASKTGSGNITVADGATLSVTATGTQVTPATLTVGTSSGATLGFNNVNSTTTALIAAGTLSSAGTITVNVNSGTFAVGQSYPLVTWTTGPVPAVSLGVLNGFSGNLSFSGNELVLNITGTAYTWTGANSGSWDLTTANNWVQNGGPKVFANGGPALFDDTASGAMAVTIGALVQPASVTVNSSINSYSIASSSGNDISGSTGLTKSGSTTLTLSGGANTYTGVTTISGGTLSVGTLANGGSASDIGSAANGAANLMFDGGTLQYTGGAASSDHLFTLTPAGGTIDASGTGALALNNAGSVAVSSSGPRTLTLTGTDVDTNTLAAVLSDSAGGGATSVTKSGAGTWILTGNNTQSGATTIAAGVLQIGNGGVTGSPGKGSIVDNSALDFDLSGSLTVGGVISGPGSVTNDGSGTVILAGNNIYTGATTINAGTVQVGNGGAAGELDANNAITDNGNLVFNSTGAFTMNSGSTIGGTGQLIKLGSGLLMLRGTETYTGGTTIGSGATLQLFSGIEGSFAGTGTITNNGTLIVVRQDNGVAGVTNNIVGTGKVVKDSNNSNNGDVTFMGTNTYTGGTFINGGAIILGDGTTPGAGSVVGNVTMTNFSVAAGNPSASTFELNRPDDLTFPGIISGAGSVLQNGNNTVTLTGANTYNQGTTISNGVLQVGAGGTSGAIGPNTVTDYGTLVFDRSDSVTFAGAINGTGSVVQYGSGTLTLSGAMNDTGPTTVSNGTLVVSSGAVGADLDVSGGTIAAAAAGSVGTLMVTNNMNIASGTVLVTLNKSLSQSNSVYSVAGAITSTGGALKLVNYGPNLVVGDQFTVFNQPVSGGAGMTIVSPGVTFANNLATDGSVMVSSIAPVPSVTAAVSGGQLQLSWPAAWTGAHLQMQTNSLSSGLGTNWVTIPGTDAGNSYTILLNNTNKCVFYRLAP